MTEFYHVLDKQKEKGPMNKRRTMDNEKRNKPLPPKLLWNSQNS